MRTLPCRAILSCMHGQGWIDRRKSASVNAVLMLVAALIPLLGAIDTSNIDHNELRPWGCRTCSVPAPPTPAEQDADPL
jgi:hypothetical protein